MTRAAIYARFSSDRQNDRSIADQIALVRRYCEQKGWTVVAIYSDSEVSGSTVHRDDFQRMQEDARARRFDKIAAEDIDRLARGEGDMPQMRRQMEFLSIEIHTVADGHVTKLHASFKGLMSSVFLDNLALHTRRGMRGLIAEGRSAGGRTYGYAPGAAKGTRIKIDAEAAVVLRIFQEYDAGRSPRAIAQRLNEDNIKPPHGRDWRASTLNGGTARGGILQNALYDGRLVWNRVTMRTDPDTGRRVSRANPQSEWVIKPVPELRIVPTELFASVQAARAERSKATPPDCRRPRHLLAGLLRCGCCGSAMVVNNVRHKGRRIYCGRRKEGGRCANGRTHKLEPIEARVVASLKAQLTDPRAIERYLATYRAERVRLARDAAGKRSVLEKQLAAATREIDRVVDGIAHGVLSDAEARARLEEPRRRRDQAQAELAVLAPPPKVIALHPEAVRRYLAAIDDLASTLTRRAVDGSDECAAALRELVAAVIVTPNAAGEPAIEVKGRLAQLTGQPLFPEQKCPPVVVAGARYVQYKSNEINDQYYGFAA